MITRKVRGTPCAAAILVAISCVIVWSKQKSLAAAPAASKPAATKVEFPERPEMTLRNKNIEFCEVHLPGGAPGLPLVLDLYLPAGRHQPKSLPCVFIAPAGSANHGMDIQEEDRVEQTPYAAAGFAVVAYELSGMLQGEKKPTHTYGELKGPISEFIAAQGGVLNAKMAIDYALAKIPEIDPTQLYACGHSSAAVVALNVALREPRIRACCAYAPLTDVETWWKSAKMEQFVPGYNAFTTQQSPLRHVGDFQCPVYLFHADDDQQVKLADNLAFVDAMKAAGKQITFDRVASGGHYDSMLQKGIPGGIRFLEAHGAKPLKPIPVGQ